MPPIGGILDGGELGIRTPGPVTVNSFQDCRIRPLCQLSVANVIIEIHLFKIISAFIVLNKIVQVGPSLYLYKNGISERTFGFKCLFLEI